MQEFAADRRREKQLYRRIRKKYKRWIYGNIGMLVCILMIVLIFLWISARVGGFTPEVFVVGAGVSFFPFLFGCICRAWAGSGGREVLLNRISDKVVLAADYMAMEYIPHARETAEFGYISYKIYYADIETLEYQEDKGRLKISGSYTITRYRQAAQGEMPGNVQKENVTDRPFYLYEHYNGIEECIKQIAGRSGRTISYEED